MTHTETLAILAALASPEPEDRRPGPAEREAAIAHVARCSDCWASLVALHELAIGTPPSESARMAELYGCGDVQPELYRLVGLDAAAVTREHPVAARHLARCLACRTRLVELDATERDVVAARWTRVVTRAGETVREAVGRLVVHVGRAVAGLAEMPEGFRVLAPVPVPAPARGTAAAPSDAPPLLGRSARFELGDTGVAAEIDVDAEDDARVALSLRLASAEREPLSVHLREVRPDGDVLVARHTLRAAEAVVVHGLWPGSFVVELHRAQDASPYRVRLDVGPA